MIKTILLIFLCISIMSCNKSEKKLKKIFESVKMTKLKFLKSKKIPKLTKVTLFLLKSHSDLLEEGASLLTSRVNKKLGRKRLERYLKKRRRLKICSPIFLKDEELRKIKIQCQVSFFNICPLSFSRYKKNRNKVIQIIKELIGKDFEKRDCQKGFSGDLK